MSTNISASVVSSTSAVQSQPKNNNQCPCDPLAIQELLELEAKIRSGKTVGWEEFKKFEDLTILLSGSSGVPNAIKNEIKDLSLKLGRAKTPDEIKACADGLDDLAKKLKKDVSPKILAAQGACDLGDELFSQTTPLTFEQEAQLINLLLEISPFGGDGSLTDRDIRDCVQKLKDNFTKMSPHEIADELTQIAGDLMSRGSNLSSKVSPQAPSSLAFRNTNLLPNLTTRRV